MPEYKRVRDPGTGAEFTYTVEQIEATGLTDADVIDKPALGSNGKPAPAKPRLPLGEPQAGSKQARRRATKKAVAKKAAAPKTAEADSLGKDAGQTSAAPETEN